MLLCSAFSLLALATAAPQCQAGSGNQFRLKYKHLGNAPRRAAYRAAAQSITIPGQNAVLKTAARGLQGLPVLPVPAAGSTPQGQPGTRLAIDSTANVSGSSTSPVGYRPATQNRSRPGRPYAHALAKLTKQSIPASLAPPTHKLADAKVLASCYLTK